MLPGISSTICAAAPSPPTPCSAHDPHQPPALIIIIDLTSPETFCHRPSLRDHHLPRDRSRH
jgi:hypothetical protein